MLATARNTMTHPSIVWTIALWIVQLLLAAAFGTAGAMKLTMPVPELVQQMAWAGDVPPWLVRFIGLSELAGAVGLVLPAATRMAPGLTPVAALGLVVVMLLAAAFHVVRGEFGALPINMTLGALAAFVAWGRTRKAPVHAR
jgi:uncharacterized membrane protein YphA (DoxX/SURF4 family)